ncbi:hypothetical protein TL16_g01590 [Triparma laevis f. inornata]|uniref:Pentatricopeptide repeat-containing protein n=2 Tax=Triparma laevis TaxID=1534972 RepID=A0A9W7BZE0_9STRA|nr:hypothetical protein TL16_g01590 [Triparma laevis f. inornata]GMH99141.1 hypothetical protein TrLO_g6891 [Triparma laevis f. longispina]
MPSRTTLLVLLLLLLQCLQISTLSTPLNTPYPPSRIGRLISRLSSSDKLGPDLRLELTNFANYTTHHPTPPNVNALCKITAECGRAGYTQLAHTFITSFTQNNLTLDKMAYLPLLGNYERNNRLSDLNATISSIMSHQQQVDPRAITIYLRSLTRTTPDKTSTAAAIASAGALHSQPLDAYAYNVVLFALSKLPDQHETFLDLYAKVKARVGLDTFSQNSLIRSLITSGKPREAVKRLAARVEANDNNIDPYSIDLVLPYLTQNWNTFGETQTNILLKSVNPPPTPQQRSAWVVSICKNQKVSVGEQLLKQSDGCDNIGWNAVIDGHRKAENFRDAFRVAKVMFRDPNPLLQPDDFTLQTLLRSRAKPQGIKRIWRMARKANMLQLESHRMSYIYELGRLGDIHEALKEFKQLETDLPPRRRLNTKSYNILLKLLCSTNYRDEYMDVAVKTVGKMKKTGPPPDSITYVEVLKALASCKPSEESRRDSKRLVQLTQNSCDGRLVNAYIRCYGDNIDEALKDWSKDIRSSLTLGGDRKQNQLQGLSGLIYCCGRAGRPDHALKIVLAINNDLKLTPTESLLQTYHNGKSVSQKKIGFAMKMHEELLEVETKKFNVKDSRSDNQQKIRILW